MARGTWFLINHRGGRRGIALAVALLLCGVLLSLLWWAGRSALPRVIGVAVAVTTGAAADPATEHAYVLDAAGMSELVLDTRSGRQIDRVPLGGSPDAVAVDSRRHRVYVAVGDANVPGSSALRILDARTDRPLGTIRLPAAPLGLPWAPLGIAVDALNGRVLVTSVDGAVRALDPVSGNVLQTWQRTLGCHGANFFPLALSVSTRTRRIFVLDHNNACVAVLDATTYRLLRMVSVGDHPLAVTIDERTARVFVANAGSGTVSMLDARTGSALRTIAVGRSPHGVAVDASIGKVFVANLEDRTVSVLDARNGAVLATLPVGVRPYAIADAGAGTQVIAAGERAATNSCLSWVPDWLCRLLPGR